MALAAKFLVYKDSLKVPRGTSSMCGEGSNIISLRTGGLFVAFFEVFLGKAYNFKNAKS